MTLTGKEKRTIQCSAAEDAYDGLDTRGLITRDDNILKIIDVPKIVKKDRIVGFRARNCISRGAAPARRFDMACCSAYYAALCPLMNRLMFTDLESLEALGAFARVKLWMDAYRATEARFVKQDPNFTDPIYEEDLPEGTAPYPDYADIWLLLSLFELSGVSTLSDEVLQPFRDLGVIEGASQ